MKIPSIPSVDKDPMQSSQENFISSFASLSSKPSVQEIELTAI